MVGLDLRQRPPHQQQPYARIPQRQQLGLAPHRPALSAAPRPAEGDILLPAPQKFLLSLIGCPDIDLHSLPLFSSKNRTLHDTPSPTSRPIGGGCPHPPASRHPLVGRDPCVPPPYTCHSPPVFTLAWRSVSPCLPLRGRWQREALTEGVRRGGRLCPPSPPTCSIPPRRPAPPAPSPPLPAPPPAASFPAPSASAIPPPSPSAP